MTTSLRLGLLVLLCVGVQKPIPSDRRTTEVQVSDLSVGSSLKAEGSATFYEEVFSDRITSRYRLDVKLTNVSSKPILAFEATVDLLPDLGGGDHVDYRRDFFFESPVLSPGGHDDLLHEPSNDSSTIESSGPLTPRKAQADVRILFVEFADGSVFGGGGWADELSTNRTRTVDQLQALLASYNTGDSAAFRLTLTKALTDSKSVDYTATKLNEIRDSMARHGLEATIEEIRTQIANADGNKRRASAFSAMH